MAVTTSGMRVPGRVDGDAGGAVEEAVAVHVLDHRAVAARPSPADSRACRTATPTFCVAGDERQRPWGRAASVFRTGASMIAFDGRQRLASRPAFVTAFPACAGWRSSRMIPRAASSWRIAIGARRSRGGCAGLAAILDQPTRSRPDRTGGAASSSRRRAMTPRTRSKWPKALRTHGASSAPPSGRRRSPRSGRAPGRTVTARPAERVQVASADARRTRSRAAVSPLRRRRGLAGRW